MRLKLDVEIRKPNANIIDTMWFKVDREALAKCPHEKVRRTFLMKNNGEISKKILYICDECKLVFEPGILFE